MIWGKKRRSRSEWHPASPWLPVRLIDGRWAWFEPVERISYFACEVRFGTPYNLPLFWCYRLAAIRNQEASQ